MSARQNIEGNIPTLALSFAGSFIILIAGQFFDSNRASAENFQIQLEKKADIEYVDQSIKTNNAATLTAIEYLVKTVDKIDKRTERLETIQMKLDK